MRRLIALLAAVSLIAGPALAGGYVPLPVFAPRGVEMQIAGDSRAAISGGNQYTLPGHVIGGTGNLTTSTTISNFVINDGTSTASMVQVGQYIYSSGASNIPNGDFITAVSGNCTTGCTITVNAAATATVTGQTININFYIPNTTFTTGQKYLSAVGWLSAWTGQAITTTLTGGYGGNFLGVIEANVINGGSGFSAVSPPVFTLTTQAAPPGQLTAAQAAASTFTCAVNAAGALTSCSPPAWPGAGYASQQTFTQTSGTAGSGEVIQFALSGSGTFGSSGDTTAGLMARLGDVLAAKPDYIFLEIGTNDLGTSVAPSTIVSNISSIANSLLQAGIIPIVEKIAPRTFGWSGTQELQRLRVNRDLEALGRTPRLGRGSGLGNLTSPIIVDLDKFAVDTASAAANNDPPVTGCLVDGLHNALPCGFFEGLALAEALGPTLPSNKPGGYGQADVFDATNNPSGNLIGAAGAFIGSGGTNSTAGSGTVAAGWTLQNGSGTAPSTLAASVVNRTDRPTGTAQQLALTSGAVSGSATSYLQMRIPSMTTGLNTCSVAQYNAGNCDYLYASVRLVLSNYHKVNRIGLTLSTDTAKGNSTQQSAICLDGGANSGSNLPDASVVAAMPLNGILPGFTQGAAGGTFIIDCITPNIQIEPGDSGYSIAIAIGYDQSSASDSATFTLQMMDAAVRKAVQ